MAICFCFVGDFIFHKIQYLRVFLLAVISGKETQLRARPSIRPSVYLSILVSGLFLSQLFISTELNYCSKTDSPVGNSEFRYYCSSSSFFVSVSFPRKNHHSRRFSVGDNQPQTKRRTCSNELTHKLWNATEILCFVLITATVIQ